MPLVTLTIFKPKSAAFNSQVLDAIHAALVALKFCGLLAAASKSNANC